MGVDHKLANHLNGAESVKAIVPIPDDGVTLQDWFTPAGLQLKMLRYYDDNEELRYDSSVLADPMARTFIDEPAIRIRRPDSLIFEGVKL